MFCAIVDTMKIHSTLVRIVTPVLISSILLLPIAPAARAEMVTTESFLALNSSLTPRDRVMSLLDQQAVILKLQEFGVSSAEAKLRVASLSDAEIEKLNGQIDQIPAGADAVGVLINTALFVFLVLLITDILCLTKVFNFTRCAGK